MSKKFFRASINIEYVVEAPDEESAYEVLDNYLSNSEIDMQDLSMDFQISKIKKSEVKKDDLVITSSEKESDDESKEE